ncbi:MAG: DUF302 domain-containing protein [Hyphomicrobiaceae bacterium]
MAGNRLIAALFTVCVLMSLPMAAGAEEYRSYVKAGKFDSVRDDLKDAIVNRGYVVDFVGHFSQMLDRTSDVAGKGAKSPYVDAEYIQFCPAKLAHDGVAASPLYIFNCPMTMYLYELKAEAGKVHVGYRLPVGAVGSEAVSRGLVELLDGIAKEAVK